MPKETVPLLLSSSIPASCETGRHLIAVDPGIVNFAYVILDINTRTAVSGQTLCVRGPHDDDEQSAAKIVGAIRSLVDLWHPEVGCVEFQGLSQITRGIQQATCAAMFAFGVPCTVIYPAQVKGHFAGLGFRGHAQNKKDAEKLVQEMGYGALENHLADAILLGLYLMETKNF